MPLGVVKAYSARLCWNSKCWTAPTGEARKLETGTWVTQTGFGHEEWIFRRGWTIEGWRYGSITPLAQSAKVSPGDTVDLRLYTIPPKGGRCCVGWIRAAEVLEYDGGIARKAQREYKRRGWLALMRNEARAVGGDARRFDKDFVNVRFRPDCVELNPLPYPEIDPADPITRCNYYDLYDAGTCVASRETAVTHNVTMKNLRRRRRRGVEGTEYDPVHDVLQYSVYKQLVSRYGAKHVKMEANHVDIEITHPERKALIELKSDPCARLAIRLALGQLLEYAFRSNHPDAELHVAAPGVPTEEDRRMLRSFRERFRFDLRYHAFSSAGDRFIL